MKGCYYWKNKFYRLCVRNPASGLLQIEHKLEIDVAIFYLGLVTGRSFMLISSLVLELWQFSFIRNWPEIRKSETTSVLVLPKICRLGQVRDIKFAMNVSNEMLLNAAKYQAYSFYRFRVIKGKTTGSRCSRIFFTLRMFVQSFLLAIFTIILSFSLSYWQTCMSRLLIFKPISLKI